MAQDGGFVQIRCIKCHGVLNCPKGAPLVSCPCGQILRVPGAAQPAQPKNITIRCQHCHGMISFPSHAQHVVCPCGSNISVLRSNQGRPPQQHHQHHQQHHHQQYPQTQQYGGPAPGQPNPAMYPAPDSQGQNQARGPHRKKKKKRRTENSDGESAPPPAASGGPPAAAAARLGSVGSSSGAGPRRDSGTEAPPAPMPAAVPPSGPTDIGASPEPGHIRGARTRGLSNSPNPGPKQQRAVVKAYDSRPSPTPDQWDAGSAALPKIGGGGGGGGGGAAPASHAPPSSQPSPLARPIAAPPSRHLRGGIESPPTLGSGGSKTGPGGLGTLTPSPVGGPRGQRRNSDRQVKLQSLSASPQAHLQATPELDPKSLPPDYLDRSSDDGGPVASDEGNAPSDGGAADRIVYGTAETKRPGDPPAAAAAVLAMGTLHRPGEARAVKGERVGATAIARGDNLEGWMIKRGKEKANWKPFYCVLTSDSIVCYDKPPGVGGVQKGVVPVVGATVVNSSQETGRNSFNVVQPDRDYILASESEQDYDVWWNAIMKRINPEAGDSEGSGSRSDSGGSVSESNAPLL